MLSIKRHMIFSTLALAITIGAGPAAMMLTSQPASAQAAGGGGGGGSGGGGGNEVSGNPALDAILASNRNDRQQAAPTYRDADGCGSYTTRTTRTKRCQAPL